MIQYKLYPLNTSEQEKGREAREKTKSENKTNDIEINSSPNDQLEKVDQKSPKIRFRNKLMGEGMKFPKRKAANELVSQLPLPR